MAANVLIRKQKIRLRTSDEQLALQMRKLLNDRIQEELTNLLERVFERNTTSDLYINFDKLSIDLGVISAHNFEKEFVRLVEPKLILELEKHLRDYMEPIYTSDMGEVKTHRSSGFDQSEFKIISRVNQELSALLYFLEKGAYPWWYIQNAPQTPAEMLAAMPMDKAENLILKIVSIQENRPDIVGRMITRLFIYLPEAKYALFIGSLTKLYNDSGLTVNTESILRNTGLLSSIFAIAEKEIYKNVFSFLIEHSDLAAENFMVNFFKQIIIHEKLSVATIKENGRASGDFRSEFGQLFSTLIKSDSWTEEPEALNKKIEKSTSSAPNHLEPDEAIYINNAGLLLLHPFLQYLFSDAGLLTSSNQFISVKAQHTATVMLYFLQSGTDNYKEWEMILNKILCGMDHEDVLPANILLSDVDKQNCDNLLTAVINHWEALKGAGIGALRNTFLLRQGKISRKESHWLIQVERTGTDILLDRLPWGYSTIKLPWLDPLIYTEW